MKNILIVTNMYPDAARPYNGIFVAEQVEAMTRLYPDLHFEVCFIDGAKGKLEYLRSVGYVNRRIRHSHYDLVHIHFGLSAMFTYSPFKSHVPMLVTFHGSDIQPKGGNGILTLATSHHAARVADACITLNKAMDAMVKQYCENTSIIPCAVDTNIFYPVERHERGEEIHIVFPCSHDMAVKNYPLFEDVLDILRTEHGIRCVEHELSGLSRPEVATLFNEADVMLMTSHSEGSPQAVKEAMACNLPVVSTPVGDVTELLEGVKDSYVSKGYDAHELAELVVKSLSRQGTGITGYEKINAMRLDSDTIAARIYAVYETLLNK